MEEKMEEKVEKLTYEQLEQAAMQMQGQLQQMQQRMHMIQVDTTFKRLDFLFKVIANISAFPMEFVEKCITEVQDIMTIPDEEPVIEE